MKRLPVCVFLAGLLASPAAAEDRVDQLAKSAEAVVPTAQPGEFRTIAEALNRNPSSLEWVEQLKPLLRRAAAASREQLADAVEHRGNSLEASLVLDRETPSTIQFNGKEIRLPGKSRGGAEAGTSGIGLSGNLEGYLGSVGVAASTNPLDHSVSANVAIGSPKLEAPLAPGVQESWTFEVIHSTKFTYGNDEYLRAHGLDARALPGGKTALKATGAMVDMLQGKKAPPDKPQSEDPLTMAVQASRETLFPNAELVENFKTATIGIGWKVTYKVEHPEAHQAATSVSFTVMDLERLAPGMQQGQGVRFLETGFEFGVSGELKGYGAGVRAGLKHSTDREAEEDRSLAAIAQWIRGDDREHLRAHFLSRTSRLTQCLPGDKDPAPPPAPAAKWRLPKSPGGIALNPGLEMPDLGEVQSVDLDYDHWRIVLRTARGRFPIERVDPQSFAVVLRAVAAGEVPYVTIGSEPSDKLGYAKVTLAPSLQNTREGLFLYRADIQFKAIFAHFSFGDAYTLNAPGDTLSAGYPGPGGESARFWITASDLRVEEKDGNLRTARHGMRILGETTLRGEVTPDPTLDAYARRLSDHWEEIADQLEEFRLVQDLALATGLAFWVREHRVKVDDAVWTLPARDATTPEYSPIVAYTTGTQAAVTGGVCLTPEEKSRGPGRTLLFLLATLLDAAEQGGVSPWLARLAFGLITAVVVAVVVLVFSGVFWLIGKWTLRGTGERLRYWRVVRTWLLAVGTAAAASTVAWFLTSGDWLSQFDRDFLAVAATFGVAPFILLFWVRRAGPALGNLGTHLARRPSGKVGLVVLALFAPAQAGSLGGAAALLTVAIVGPIPGPGMEQVLTVELAPSEVMGRLAGAGANAPARPSRDGRPAPVVMQSLRQAWAEPFSHDAGSAGAEHADQIQLQGSPDSALPAQTLKRIEWPPDRPVPAKGAHYSTDGKPPF